MHTHTYIYIYIIFICIVVIHAFNLIWALKNMGCGKGSSYCSERVLGVDSMLTFSSRISSIRRNPRDPTVTTLLVKPLPWKPLILTEVGWPFHWNAMMIPNEHSKHLLVDDWLGVYAIQKKGGGIISPFLSRTKGWHIGSWTLLNWNTMLQNDCDMREPSEWIIWGLLFGFKQPRTNIWIVTHLITHIYYPYHIQNHHYGSV